MKTIPNIQTSLASDKEGGPNACFSDLLKSSLNFAPQGFSIELMRKRERVAKVIEKVAPGGDMVFEDADYATAQEAVKAVVWLKFHKDYIAFADAFGV